MQKIAKPAVNPPKGSHRFSALLEMDRKPEPTDMRTFLLNAHRYGQEKFGSALMGVMQKPQWEIENETHGAIGSLKNTLFNPSRIIERSSDLDVAAKRLLIGRNAIIPHHLTTEPYMNHAFRPYQELCSEALSESDPGQKARYIWALGVLGNLLPAEEKTKLGKFLIEFMQVEQGTLLRLTSMGALATLLCANAAEPIARAGEATEDWHVESAAFRISLSLSRLSSQHATERLLLSFLFGDYSARTKFSTAFFVGSMKNPLIRRHFDIYLEDVDSTVKDLQGFTMAKLGVGGALSQEAISAVNDLLMNYYKESGYIKDVRACDALLAFLKTGGEC
jgi:hypothetical protein